MPKEPRRSIGDETSGGRLSPVDPGRDRFEASAEPIEQLGDRRDPSGGDEHDRAEDDRPDERPDRERGTHS